MTPAPKNNVEITIIRQYLHFFLYLLIPALTVLSVFPGTVRATEELESNTDIPELINDFKSCAVTGLKRIPQLQRSKMEVEIRRLDEDDSRWSYVPRISLSTNYYFTENDTTISLNAANYRPWEPYFTLAAREIITRIAMLEHLKATAQSLFSLADTLLQIVALDQKNTVYEKMRELSEKKLNYIRQRSQNGTAPPIELEIAAQEHTVVISEQQANTIQRDALLNGLCISLDIPDSGIFKFDSSLVLKQILGSSIPSASQKIPQPEDSIARQIAILKERLQEKRILLAYSKYMPDVTLGVRSPDVLNVSVNNEQNLFLYTGITLTLWDGKKRSRDITRQKMVLRQMKFKNRAIKNSASLEWFRATKEFSLAKSRNTLFLSSLKLKEIQIKKSESDYSSGSISLPELLSLQIDLLRNRIKAIEKNHSTNQAWLKLRHLSGQLLKDTLNISFMDSSHE